MAEEIASMFIFSNKLQRVSVDGISLTKAPIKVEKAVATPDFFKSD